MVGVANAGLAGYDQADWDLRRSRRVCFFVEAAGGGGEEREGSGRGSVLGSRCMMGRWSMPLLWQGPMQTQLDPLRNFDSPVPLHRTQVA